ncbi:MAG TPA: uroporphyrinogen-III synthase [Acidobacteriota bacterium]|jgi:uroporphyrinogen-III synthase
MSLKGKRIALLESRMSSELAMLVQRQGGTPYCVPAVRESPLDCTDQVKALIDHLEQGRLNMVVFQTGVGVKALLRESERLERREQLIALLSGVITVCRGPKPTAVLKQNAIPISAAVREPYTTHELVEALTALHPEGKRIAVIHYGERNTLLTDTLRGSGSLVEEICLYEWLLPEDLTSLRNLVDEVVGGRVDAIAFTNQIQIRHLFQIAADLGQERQLAGAMREKVVVASVGPTCTATLKEFGIIPAVIPSHPKMGPLVYALSEHFGPKAKD